MNSKLYNAIYGGLLLISLYFSLDILTKILIALVFLEGLTNIILARYLVNFPVAFFNDAPPPAMRKIQTGILDFNAPRIWRFMVGSILFVSFLLFNNELWFIPWFMGFAIFGAGISGVCPMLFMIQKLGFK